MIRSTSFFCLTVKLVSLLTANHGWASSSSDRRNYYHRYVSIGRWSLSQRHHEGRIGGKSTRVITHRRRGSNLHLLNEQRVSSIVGPEREEIATSLRFNDGNDVPKTDSFSEHGLDRIRRAAKFETQVASTNLSLEKDLEDFNFGALAKVVQKKLKRIVRGVTEKGVVVKGRVRLILRQESDMSIKTPLIADNDSDESNNDDSNNVANPQIKQTLVLPLMEEDIWNELDGTEFQRFPETWDQLALMGQRVAAHDEPDEWIEWKRYGDASSSLENGDIQVWTGKSKKQHVRGQSIPWIKTRSIIPFRPVEMVELLLDSDRVKTYNQWSLGRRDCWVASTTTIQTTTNNEDEISPTVNTFAPTKIVKNRVQPPLGARPMISTTLLHAQRLSDNDGDENSDTWIVVSRAVGGKAFDEADDVDVGHSEILLGVNLLRPCPTNQNKCILTAVTHVYSSAVPSLLAERVGVQSAIKFVRDMRALKPSSGTVVDTTSTEEHTTTETKGDTGKKKRKLSTKAPVAGLSDETDASDPELTSTASEGMISSDIHAVNAVKLVDEVETTTLREAVERWNTADGAYHIIQDMEDDDDDDQQSSPLSKRKEIILVKQDSKTLPRNGLFTEDLTSPTSRFETRPETFIATAMSRNRHDDMDGTSNDSNHASHNSCPPENLEELSNEEILDQLAGKFID